MVSQVCVKLLYHMNVQINLVSEPAKALFRFAPHFFKFSLELSTEFTHIRFELTAEFTHIRFDLTAEFTHIRFDLASKFGQLHLNCLPHGTSLFKSFFDFSLETMEPRLNR